MHTVAVIGCGAIGLTSALAIQEELGPLVRVKIFTEDISPNTTGDIAAGLWTPIYLQDTPPGQINEWSKVTHDYIQKLWQAGEAKEAGISLQLILALSTDSQQDIPDWVDLTLGHSVLTEDQLRYYGTKLDKNLKSGLSYVSFVWEAPKFLPYLQQKFVENGGEIVMKKIQNFDELADFNVIVNCTGLQARYLVPDLLVQPIQGQVTRAVAPWQFHTMFMIKGDEDNYIIPNHESVILGGTHQLDDYNTTVDERDKKFILNNCAELVPSLKSVTAMKHVVGLRPGRSQVRLDLELRRSGDKVLRIVHNYGHGGSGITLSIGCALSAAKLVKKALDRPFISKL